MPIPDHHIYTRSTQHDNQNLTPDERKDRLETRVILAALLAKEKLRKLHSDLAEHGVKPYNADF